jgi:hypothetical protein
MFARAAPGLRQSAFEETFAVFADLGMRNATGAIRFSIRPWQFPDKKPSLSKKSVALQSFCM